MKRQVWTFAAALAASPLVGWPAGVSAQQLSDQQILGMRLFNQSCRVCHTKPQLSSPLYGPALSRQSLNGDVSVMREVISNGTPRMPGFKYTFNDTQIAAIASYLKTVAPQAAPAPAATKREGREAD